MISYEKALKLIKKNVYFVNKKHKILTLNAVGYCLAEDIYSNINIPPQNNSAVDGYAFNYTEYKKRKKLKYELIGRGAIWSDAGKIEDLSNVTNYVRSVEKVQGIKIACLEEISLLKNWINKKRIKENIKFYGNCEYSIYLKKIIT